MTFLRFKLTCNCTYEGIEMNLIEDDMAWEFECPKCNHKVSVQNWTSDTMDKKEKTLVTDEMRKSK